MEQRISRQEHTCQKCGRTIKKGETVIYAQPRGLKAFYRCVDCGLYQEEIFEMQAEQWQRRDNYGHSWKR
nr:MAG TPA: transcription factor IIS-like protein [Bacteriophage sp.]